jgi:ABC-2 type transport system permease protein
MPVFDQGYRRYEGKRISRLFRWWPISIGCLRAVPKKGFVVVLIAAAVPLVIQMVLAYAIGQLERGLPPIIHIPGGFLGGFDDRLFFTLISHEVFWAVLMAMIIGAGQIAEDVRTGAMQIYFSKPITHLDYVLGKMGTVVLATSLVTLVPAAILFLGVMAFAPDFSFLEESPMLPFGVLGFSLLTCVVLSAVVLGLSSLGRRGRLVQIVFAGGYFLTMALGNILPEVFDDSRWKVVHLGNCLDVAGRTMFSKGPVPAGAPTTAWLILGGLVAVSLALLARRIRAVEVVE